MEINRKNNNLVGGLNGQSAPGGWRNTANPEEIERRVFLQQNDLKPVKNKKLSEFIDWTWSLIRRPVLILFVLQVVVYILAKMSFVQSLAQRVIDPLLLLVNLAVFGWLASESKLKYNKKLGVSILVAFNGGVCLGILVALFKFVWIREYWTIFNLVIEPVYTGLLAAGAGWVAYIFTKKK